MSSFSASTEEWESFAATPQIAGLAGMPAKYLTGETTLQGISDTPVRRIIQRYLANIVWAKDHRKGIAFCGGQGSGKTSALALVAEAWGRKFGVRRHMNPHDRFSEEVTTMAYIAQPEFCLTFNMIPAPDQKEALERQLRRLCTVDLLLLDDLGSGELSKNGTTALVTLLEYRITTTRVTCLTVNGTIDDMRSIPGLARIPDKMRDCLVRPVPFPDASRREFVGWDDIGR